jgi:hypothetical protein
MQPALLGIQRQFLSKKMIVETVVANTPENDAH